MKTTEIEIWDVSKIGNAYAVEYEFEGNDCLLTLTIPTLIQFIEDMELNFLYINAPDELTEVDALSYLEDNYFEVVKQYLNDLHKC